MYIIPQMTPTLYRWHSRTRLPERHGQLVRLICTGRLNSCLVEFVSDGWRVVTSRYAIRRVG
jgi:hypothetical protein